MVLEKIKKILDKAGVFYEVLEHEPVYTSRDAAKIRDVDPSMGAKALVLVADGKPILVVVPGDKKLDFKKFKASYRIKDLRMASADEVKEITTLEIGSIPPLGKALGLKSYYDESFLHKEKVAFNAGLHTTSIIMGALDLVEVEKPKISDLIES